jgi:hypothetical protein
MEYTDEVHTIPIDTILPRQTFVELLANIWRFIVGFTGSGQPMRKDATRGKHIYQQGEEEE